MGHEKGLEAVIKLTKLASKWDAVVVSPVDGQLQVTSARVTPGGGTMSVDFLDDLGDFDIERRIQGLEMDNIFYSAIPPLTVEGDFGGDDKISFDAAPALFAFRKAKAHDVLGRTFEDAVAGVMGEGVCMAGEALLENKDGIEAEVSGELYPETLLGWFDRLEQSKNGVASEFGGEMREFFNNVSSAMDEEDEEDNAPGL